MIRTLVASALALAAAVPAASDSEPADEVSLGGYRPRNYHPFSNGGFKKKPMPIPLNAPDSYPDVDDPGLGAKSRALDVDAKHARGKSSIPEQKGLKDPKFYHVGPKTWKQKWKNHGPDPNAPAGCHCSHAECQNKVPNGLDANEKVQKWRNLCAKPTCCGCSRCLPPNDESVLRTMTTGRKVIASMVMNNYPSSSIQNIEQCRAWWQAAGIRPASGAALQQGMNEGLAGFDYIYTNTGSFNSLPRGCLIIVNGFMQSAFNGGKWIMMWYNEANANDHLTDFLFECSDVQPGYCNPPNVPRWSGEVAAQGRGNTFFPNGPVGPRAREEVAQMLQAFNESDTMHTLAADRWAKILAAGLTDPPPTNLGVTYITEERVKAYIAEHGPCSSNDVQGHFNTILEVPDKGTTSLQVETEVTVNIQQLMDNTEIVADAGHQYSLP
jgi:hypothetical protein